MKLRCRLASTGVMGCLAVTVVTAFSSLAQDSASPGLAETTLWTPDLFARPVQVDARRLRLSKQRQGPAPLVAAQELVTAVTSSAPPPSAERQLTTWSRDIASGETLDAVLADAGLAASDRVEVALALGAEYDLRRLQTGHAVTVVTTSDGVPRRVLLEVDDGVVIEAVFGERLTTRVLTPEPELVPRVGEAVIETSLFTALDSADIPARFAVDLAQMLGGNVDFRRDLSGGETLRLLWREARVDDEIVGQPEITFAALDLGDVLYEVIWPEDGSGRATIYRDGEVMRVFAQPVEGAQLSSVFGRRRHPVYGDVRMHTGVDFAAARGTPVHATAPGRIAYVGWRSGYGRTVEIVHGSDTVTRYAHLSAVPEGLAAGQRVAAGDLIGNVGATGTATGPNLHYEVLMDGRPTDPLSDDWLAGAAQTAAHDEDAGRRLQEARARLQDLLAVGPANPPNERI